METRRLWLDGDCIIVNAGSAREKELLALGWKGEGKSQRSGRARKTAVGAGENAPDNQPGESGSDSGAEGNPLASGEGNALGADC